MPESCLVLNTLQEASCNKEKACEVICKTSSQSRTRNILMGHMADLASDAPTVNAKSLIAGPSRRDDVNVETIFSVTSKDPHASEGVRDCGKKPEVDGANAFQGN